MRGTKNGWTLLLLMLAGVVIGGFIGSIASRCAGTGLAELRAGIRT